MPVVVAILAWALAALNGAAALGKALDLPGFVLVLAEYRLVPGALLVPGAILLVLAEAAIAMGLLLPRLRREAALAAAALAAIYGLALTVTLLRGIELRNCGCFGVFLARPLTVFSPLEDVLLVLLALLVAARTRPA
ncbi:MauE/DoxX family redox-associated membrane protein [Falsiroseomonas sp. HC035]|uniref:MauE/DoxX family redox-associated membrane protein n=1 Tax=Falsiroseomonas sp. HC035 TaxID=3390999 RepID=UPI003D319A3B